MPSRSVRASSARRSSFVPPALLVALVSLGGCSTSDGNPVRRLQQAFPAHANEVLVGDDRGFAESANGFSSRKVPAWSAALDVELPRSSRDAVVFHARGIDVSVRELAVPAQGQLVEHGVVSYERGDATSFWNAIPGAIEEWIHLEASAVKRDKCVAAWEVEGALLRERQGVVEVVDTHGVVQVSVSAPAAYATTGRSVATELRVRGARIELYVDAENEPVLVDPQWTQVSPLVTARYDHASTLLQDGTVLVTGGDNGLLITSYASTEIYNPAKDKWTAGTDLNTARSHHTATTLQDGTAIVTGGEVQGTIAFQDSEIYDPAQKTWTATSMNDPHSRHTALLLSTGELLIAGGYYGNSGTPTLSAVAELYDTASGWNITGSMNEGRASHVMAQLPLGRVLIAGGDGPTTTSEIWDPTSKQWTYTGQGMNVPRTTFAATTLKDGTVLVEGGDGGDFGIQDTAEIYDPVADSWTTVGPMSSARELHTASLLSDGSVLVAGGTDGSSSLATAEIYDPKKQTWKTVPSMNTVRDSHTATTLDDGSIFVVGGDTASDAPTKTAEIFALGLPNGSTCAVNKDCVSTACFEQMCCDKLCDPTAEYCDTGTCTKKKPLGKPAVANDECVSGFQSDGLCCDKACSTKPCEVCSVAAGATSDGTCTNTTVSCDDGDACTKTDTCVNGACVGGSPKVCAPIDSCHQDGACNPADGTCSPVRKPDGAACEDGNPCTADTCQAGVCVSVNELDGTQCEGGVCIAGGCVQDPELSSSASTGASSSSAAASTTGAGGATPISGAGGAGGAGGGDPAGNAMLVGGGCSTAPAPRSSLAAWLAGLVVALPVFVRRRAKTRPRA